MMKKAGILITILLAASCWAQDSGGFQPATTNVWGADYPRVDGSGRIQIRVKARDATKVRLNFWSGPKVAEVEFQEQQLTSIPDAITVPPFSVSIYSFAVQ